MNFFSNTINNFKKKNIIKELRALRLEIEGNFIAGAGRELSNYIRPMIKEKEKFDNLMDRLVLLDPNCPTFRYRDSENQNEG